MARLISPNPKQQHPFDPSLSKHPWPRCIVCGYGLTHPLHKLPSDPADIDWPTPGKKAA